MAQFAALTLLRDGPLPAAELARRSFTTRQSVHDVLAGLYERGFVEKGLPAGNGRRQPVALTAAGRAAVHGADRVVQLVGERMTGTLTPAERRKLLSWLDECAENLQRPPTRRSVSRGRSAGGDPRDAATAG